MVLKVKDTDNFRRRHTDRRFAVEDHLVFFYFICFCKCYWLNIVQLQRLSLYQPHFWFEYLYVTCARHEYRSLSLDVPYGHLPWLPFLKRKKLANHDSKYNRNRNRRSNLNLMSLDLVSSLGWSNGDQKVGKTLPRTSVKRKYPRAEKSSGMSAFMGPQPLLPPPLFRAWRMLVSMDSLAMCHRVRTMDGADWLIADVAGDGGLLRQTRSVPAARRVHDDAMWCHRAPAASGHQLRCAVPTADRSICGFRHMSQDWNYSSRVGPSSEIYRYSQRECTCRREVA